MPHVYVDFSVYSAYLAQGNVHGTLDLPTLPEVGEAVSFADLKNTVPPPEVDGFVPRIIVKHVLPPVQGSHGVPSLSLADVQVTTTAEAEKVFAYFEQGFGLFADRFQESSHG